MAELDEVTHLLAIARNGDPHAMERVFALVYQDLKRIAHRQLTSLPSHPTLGTTALVHESYLKLTRGASITPEDRRHFLAIAARAMRQIAVDYVREWSAAKRGGGKKALAIEDAEVLPDPTTLDLHERAEEILAIDRAIERLGRLNPQMSRLVELRFFGGLSVEQTADVMELSPRSVKRLWQIARALLHQELRPEEGA